ncbi:DNA primase family protein [Cetobacterium sp.]|uniref:DNA primase family protein n=1 Tax=Cetobacterium sp. TaxID=2071632 RepID=UPI003F342C03
MKNQFANAKNLKETILKQNTHLTIEEKFETMISAARILAKNGIRNNIVAEETLKQLLSNIVSPSNVDKKISEYLNIFKKEKSQAIASDVREKQKISYFKGGFYRYIDNEGYYIPIETRKIEQSIKEEAKEALKVKEISEIKGQIIIDAGISDNQINNHRTQNLIHSKNCMLRIDGDNIVELPHSKEYYSTSCLAVPYNPEAKCPKWLSFLNETFEHYGEEKEQVIQVLKEMMGYMCIPGNKYQKMFALIGVPRSGKSVIGDIITAILSSSNVSSYPLELIDKETHLADLSDKLLNLSGELPANTKIATSTIKSIIGEDKISGRFLYSNSFTFVSPAKLMVIGNHLPHFNDSSTAMKERLVILEFEREISQEKRNPYLKEELKEELEGIFNWAIKGLVSLKKRGRFLELRKELEMKELIQKIADTVEDWQSELELESLEYDSRDENGVVITLKKLYDNYKLFCKENNLMAEKRQNFKLKLNGIKEIKVYKDLGKNQDYVEIKKTM